MIGRTLSHYSLEAPLGKGGMGEVYSARDERLGRSVAIKILPDASSRDSVQRFLTEAKAASALNHPNIVTVHEIDHAEGIHFIVMEKIDGVSLAGIAGAPMPIDRFLDIALQTTSALAAAHAAGIVHRDIKPANIMVTPSGAVKVVDFGLARLMVTETASGEDVTAKWVEQPTKPGMVVGTIGYMSPEQVEGHRADARSDVFSLGVVFYTLLTGRAPFSQSSPMVTMAAILRDDPPRLDGTVPRPVADIVHRCMHKDPALRYANGAEVHEALRTVQAAPLRRRAAVVPIAIAVAIAVIALAAFFWRRESQRRWARDMAPLEVERLLEADDPAAAYLVAKRAVALAPADSQVNQMWANLTFVPTIRSEPAGATVEIQSYKKRDGPWVTLGRTPLTQFAIPYPLVRFRITHDGFAPLEIAPEFSGTEMNFRLWRDGDAPRDMVRVSPGPAVFSETTKTVPEFWIDRHEVTNGEFKRFVDAGGYRRKDLWKLPFVDAGKPLTWEEAMARFVDRTGRTGPGAWELGAIPEGRENHPVEAISMYEAAAFAEFSGKTLPTVFHWMRAAEQNGIFADMLSMSNFASKSAVPVESLGSLGAWGTYDMAGNVEEWCTNDVGTGAQKYILGASWKDATYQYREADAAEPIERREGVGFRLIRQQTPIAADLLGVVQRPQLQNTPPVDDATFAIYRRLYDYDPIPLDVRVEETDDSHAAWRKERVSYMTAYGERMAAYVFVPKNAKPPYQAIVYFPGSDAVFERSSRKLWMRMVEFYVRSGRLLVYPVYKGTYERQVPRSGGLNARRDLRIMRTKDVRRTLDYLVTRRDVDAQRIGYYGLSLGASISPLVLATEPRFRCAVLLGGGLSASPSLPEARQENFLPRVTVPTLLIAGRYDFTFPAETSQRGFFELLGTPPDRKKYYSYEGGHLPNQFNEAVKEMLAWTDRWLGPV